MSRAQVVVSGFAAENAALDAPLARAFCASPEYKKLSCDGRSHGLMERLQYRAVVNATCRGCGVRYMNVGVGSDLPLTLQPIGSSTYALEHISLACRGPVLVRAVFNALTDTPFIRKDGVSVIPDCTAFALRPKSDEEGRPNSPTIRCELQLPAGPGSEEERALRGKEVNCVQCGDCYAKPRERCPWKKGTWYSDTFTTVAEGCGLNPAGYYAHTVGFDIFGGVKVRLAKFEVCQPGSCYNQAYEAAKQKAAQKCLWSNDKNQWECNKK